MINLKKLSISIASILVCILLGITCILSLQENLKLVSAASSSQQDITTLTQQDNVNINNQINTAWNWAADTSNGNIKSPVAINSLNDIDFTKSGQYYLTQDITDNNNTVHVMHYTSNVYRNICLLLNGYSISGNVKIVLDSTGSNLNSKPNRPKVSFTFMDKHFRNISNTGYNPTPEKYYKFNTSTGRYSDYSNTIPNRATDVTNMPTWTENTYIKVTGGTISPNTLSMNSKVMLLAYRSNDSIMNFFDTNIIGTETCNNINVNYAGNNALIASVGGRIYFARSTIIGNRTAFGNLVVVTNRNSDDAASVITIEGTKLYGNTTTLANAAIAPGYIGAPYNSCDLLVKQTWGYLTIKNSDVGVYSNHDRKNIVFMKGMKFNDQIYSIRNVEDLVNQLNTKAESGTFEFIKSITTTITNNLSNVNFIVHGNSGLNCGDNSIEIQKNIEGIATANDTTSTNSKIKLTSTGKAKSIASNMTPITLENGAEAAIPYGKYAGKVNNEGSLTVNGTIDNLTSNAGSVIVNGTIDNLASNTGNVTVNNAGVIKNLQEHQSNSLTIENGGTVTINTVKNGASVTNAGRLNLANGIENIDNLTNTNGILNLMNNVNLQLTKGKIIEGKVINAGKLSAEGKISHLVTVDGVTMIMSNAEVNDLNIVGGIIYIMSNTAKLAED